MLFVVVVDVDCDGLESVVVVLIGPIGPSVVVVGVVTVLDMVVGLLLVVLIAEVLAGFETLVEVVVLEIVEVDAGLLLTEELVLDGVAADTLEASDVVGLLTEEVEVAEFEGFGFSIVMLFVPTGFAAGLAEIEEVGEEWLDEELLLEPFTIKTVAGIIESEGGRAPEIKDNILELVSQWSRYRGWWYATLACAGKTGSNGLVVRTKDFKIMEYVAMPPFNQDGMAEISSIIKDGKLFVACRQNYGIFKLLLSYYDLREGSWGPVTSIEDGNSRPWFFIRRNRLYLMNTPDKPRKYINVSAITLDDTSAIRAGKVTTLQDCGFYYAPASYRGRLYMVVTLNTESFGQLTLTIPKRTME